MAKEYFPQIGKIPFEGTASKNVLAFHYYEPERVVMGKKMKDWMRFAMAWWHTLGQASGDPFGGQTRSYEWAELRDRNFYEVNPESWTQLKGSHEAQIKFGRETCSD